MIINSDDYTTLLSYDIEDLITHENLTLQNKIKEKDKEIERLNNIIKEAIEYIVHPTFKGTHSTNEEVLVDILRILKGE